MKSKLVFSASGTSVCIQFTNGSESFDFDTKEDALYAVRDCATLGKITKEEEKIFIKEILLAPNLQNRKKELPLFPLLLLALLFEQEENDNGEFHIKHPSVNMCPCGKKRPHAYIYDGEVKVSLPFSFKSEGFALVKGLFEMKKITEADQISLRTLIDLLPIPESPTLN